MIEYLQVTFIEGGLTLPVILFRLCLAMLLSGVLGMERGTKKRAAGFRTYMIVSMGAALVMITSEYLFKTFQAGDPTRLGAQVISGIGFLGVGTIISTHRNQVRGLTTAAGLWVSACIGLSVGIGFYVGAVACAGLVLFSMTVLRHCENWFYARSRQINIFAEFVNMQDLGSFLEKVKAAPYVVSDLQVEKNKEAGGWIGVILTLKASKPAPHQQIIEFLCSYPEIKSLIEIE